MNLVLAASCMIGAMTSQTANVVWDLWPAGNPGGWKISEPESAKEENGILVVRNVNKPTLTFYPSKVAKPGAPTVLVCPGGGYFILASGHEGSDIAEWLNKEGVHAAVLKYRLPIPDVDKVRHLPALQDAQRAIRILRSKASELNLAADKIGIMGFSAGGHLAAMASNAKDAYDKTDATDDLSALPNFTILIYGAYMESDGKATLPENLTVTKQTPPAFLVHTMDDYVPVQSSLAYVLACKAVDVPVEMHLFAKGGHGYGLRSQEPGLKEWPNLLSAWLMRR